MTAAVLGVVLVLVVLFPGQRLGLALTLGSGVGTSRLQRRIDAIEERAIRKTALSKDDRRFLADFYATLATGAKLTIVVAQTGRLMDHYLGGSGTDYQLDAQIFTENAKVQRQLALLRRRAAGLPCQGAELESPTFYMPDRSKLDSVFGLYHGKVKVTAGPSSGGCRLRFRAEVPWFWPSYASLQAKWGDAHAESFPLPNAASLLLGQQHALFVDNGLGEHLAQIGLAKPFLAFAEWDEQS